MRKLTKKVVAIVVGCVVGSLVATVGYTSFKDNYLNLNSVISYQTSEDGISITTSSGDVYWLEVSESEVR